jgi:hypothetical protein
LEAGRVADHESMSKPGDIHRANLSENPPSTLYNSPINGWPL